MRDILAPHPSAAAAPCVTTGVGDEVAEQGRGPLPSRAAPVAHGVRLEPKRSNFSDTPSTPFVCCDQPWAFVPLRPVERP